MEHFKEGLPLLTAVIVLLSAATFGFLLPKWADHFNDRPRTKLKDVLDIKKNLQGLDKPVDPDLDRIIRLLSKRTNP